MKTFLIVAIIAFAVSAFAQNTPPPDQPVKEQAPQTAHQSKGDAGKDFESRMSQFEESYSKMQAKSSKVKDPKMKVDFDAMLAKMNTINSDYQGMKATGTSEQQQKQTQKKIESEMKDLRKMHDDMKAKYGDQMGGKKKGNQTNPDDKTLPKDSGEDIK